MENFINEMIKEFVWQQITIDFYNFVTEHSKTLSKKEQIAFVNLINNSDEYSFQILKQIWKEFEVTGCSKERIQELYEIEVKKISAINI